MNFNSLIFSIQKISNKKIAEIVVRPNFSGSDDFSVLLNCKNFKTTPEFTYKTGITYFDLASAPKASEAFSILQQAWRVSELPWYTWSEIDARLILHELPSVNKNFLVVEEMVTNCFNKTIQDLNHALELFDIPQMGDETETEKVQLILEKLKKEKNNFLSTKRQKKYIIEIKGR